MSASLSQKYSMLKVNLEPDAVDHADGEVGHALDDLLRQRGRVLVALERRAAGIVDGVDDAVHAHLPVEPASLDRGLGALERLLRDARGAADPVDLRGQVDAGQDGVERLPDAVDPPVDLGDRPAELVVVPDQERQDPDAVDFTGLIHIGYDTPGGGRASSPSSSTRPNAGSSSITSACSRRHQYLCSHFTTDSRLEERSPYLAHRIGAIVVTGKSQNPTIASIGPSKASSCRCASASAPSKSITPSRSSRRLISPWKRQSYRCSSRCRTRRFTSSRPSTNTLRGMRRPPSDRFPRGLPPAVALGVSGKATSKRPAARSGGLRSGGDAVTVRMNL